MKAVEQHSRGSEGWRWRAAPCCLPTVVKVVVLPARAGRSRICQDRGAPSDLSIGSRCRLCRLRTSTSWLTVSLLCRAGCRTGVANWLATPAKCRGFFDSVKWTSALGFGGCLLLAGKRPRRLTVLTGPAAPLVSKFLTEVGGGGSGWRRRAAVRPDRRRWASPRSRRSRVDPVRAFGHAG